MWTLPLLVALSLCLCVSVSLSVCLSLSLSLSLYIYIYIYVYLYIRKPVLHIYFFLLYVYKTGFLVFIFIVLLIFPRYRAVFPFHMCYRFLSLLKSSQWSLCWFPQLKIFLFLMETHNPLSWNAVMPVMCQRMLLALSHMSFIWSLQHCCEAGGIISATGMKTLRFRLLTWLSKIHLARKRQS